jgi:hypothetical protein
MGIMHKLLSISLLVLFCSCQGNETALSESNTIQIDSVPAPVIKDAAVLNDTILSTSDIITFKTLFLTRFSSDSLFQISFTKFPFIEKGYERNLETNEDYLYEKRTSIKGWRHVDLRYDSSAYYQKYDKYTQDLEKKGDTIHINYRGLDNGIYFGYTFAKDSVWRLVSMYDFSN